MQAPEMPPHATARVDELRRSIAEVGEAELRARLRVELADLLRLHGDLPASVAELLQAVRDAPRAEVVELSLLPAVATLPPADRAAALDQALAAAGRPVAAWLREAAGAHEAAGHSELASARYLEWARGARTSAESLAAARHALRVATAAGMRRARLDALRGAAAAAPRRERCALLGEALREAESLSDVAAVVELLVPWLEAGGKPARALAYARRATELGAPPEQVAAVVSSVTVAEPSRAASGVVQPASTASRPAPASILDAAARAARALQPLRARRLAERAVRCGASAMAPLAEIHAALRKTGNLEQSLLLRRTELESSETGEQAKELERLVAEAEGEGLFELAARFRHDLQPAASRAPSRAGGDPRTPAQVFIAAQRTIAALTPGSDARPVLAVLGRCLTGHDAADDALDLAVRVARDAGLSPVPVLRQAFLGEAQLARRVRLAERIAMALDESGDVDTALSFLDEALDVPPVKETIPLRRRRAQLLRRQGLRERLVVALGADAEALTADARRAALAERAQLLDELGKPDQALQVRIEALHDVPADPELLAAARARLQAKGDKKTSLRLLTAAAAVVGLDDGVRRRLLAELAETAAGVEGKEADALDAWLAVLDADPSHQRAGEEVERLLRASSQWERAAQVLAFRAARESNASSRALLLWRVAEVRRTYLGQPEEAFRLYRELAPPTTSLPRRLPRDAADAVLHAARALVAPTPEEKAAALLDRGEVALQAGRLEDAEPDLRRAFELDPANAGIVLALERVHEPRGSWDEFEQLMTARRDQLTAPAQARSWFGSGRAAERRGDTARAAACYRKAVELDSRFREPLSALRAQAVSRAEHVEALRLLELERTLETRPAQRLTILLELGNLLGTRLSEAARAIDVLEEALTLAPEHEPALRSLTALYVQRGIWDRAAATLEKRVTLGHPVPDAADTYHRLARAAEDAHELDRALQLYSRAYGRNSSHRPTLERLSEICFAQAQWENAVKATSALLDRHAEAMQPAQIAELAVRGAVAELHVAQRARAVALVTRMMGARGGLELGIRDVAEAWAAMRLEPRLMAGLDAKRRQRVMARITQAVAAAEQLPASPPVMALRDAWKLSAALAVVEERWDDAIVLLDRLGRDGSLPHSERFAYHLAAGDVARQQGDPSRALAAYRRARAIRPADARLLNRLDQTDPTASASALDDEPTHS